MKKFLPFLLAIITVLVQSGFSQSIKTPEEFLGYKPGEQFTPHYRVVDYYRYLAGASKNIRLQDYGKTNEGRPLILAIIGSDANINRVEEIRENNLRLAGIKAGSPAAGQPAVVWLSYNVHGNEAVSTEASLQTAYDLLDPANRKTKAWLQNTLVIIDPCLNPDGRERYVNFYNPVRNAQPDAQPFSREHFEPWPGGRSNHYYFDLNRDWAWQSQLETQHRMQVYNQWLPQVHVDFHEQGVNDPYYFAPAAEPYHEDITKWQREFQTIIGRNNAAYFDRNGWMYFTKERFDLLYPSYGDTYPIYNGSIGMTYEQGGSGRAGLAVLNSEGDTLTLKDRIEHHHTTGLSTIEAVSQNAERAVSEFRNYFLTGKTNPPGEFRTYVVKGENTEKLKTLATMLQRNGIEFGYGAAKGANGFNYFTGRNESFRIDRGDMVISAYQPKSVLLKVLFEPETFVSDSATYDITAWSLPYAFGLQTYASKEALKPAYAEPLPEQVSTAGGSANPVAFIANWNSVSDVKFLALLLKNNIKVRYSEVPFETGGRRFNAGSLIIARTSNTSLGERFGQVITNLASASGVSLQAMSSAFVDKGADLGSNKVRMIKRSRIMAVVGDSSSPGSFGEIWHFFEQQIKYPLTVVRNSEIGRVSLSDFDVIIFADGSYPESSSDRMLQWVRGGGTLILTESAVSEVAGKKGFDLKNKEEGKKNEKDLDPYGDLKIYENRERESVRSNIPGAIYKVDLDNSHPLAFGFPDFYYTLKLDDKVYQFLKPGWNVGIIKKDNYVAGFVGTQARKKLVDGLLFGVQEHGAGSIVYLADNLLFRSFWENGKLMFSNAVFMVGR